MPAKKSAPKAKPSSAGAPPTQPPTQPQNTPSSKSQPAPQSQPPQQTVNERSWQRYYATNPYAAAVERAGGLSGLSAAEQAGLTHAAFARASAAARAALSPKAQRDAWRYVNEHSLPTRCLPRPRPGQWGTDRAGRDVGEYTPDEFAARTAALDDLAVLELESEAFRDRRERAMDDRHSDSVTGEKLVVTETEVEEEARRREEMAALRRDLYGQKMGAYEQDPEWDDVVPIPVEEPEGALAAIAYSDDYAEATSYLRAVMLKKEYSARCLKLTEHVTSMNPAHYTAWLYRASIVLALKISIPDELEWLNGVALENLKNYQIWHHRHLLVEEHYETMADDQAKVAAFAASERAFITTILAEDAKNYHVWSYRTWLVGKLGLHSDAAELAAVVRLLDEDVRNNSAWSHRFFLVLSDPAHTTPGLAATEPDPRIPAEVVDREVRFAMDRTYLAPQNQSAWNYLRGALVKGGRKLASVQAFTEEFVSGLGEEGTQEVVRSTHALDLLAEIYAEKGEKEKADLCLKRLAEKWDRVRAGYWAWKRKCLEEAK